MNTANGLQYSQKRQEDLQRLKNFRLLDDDFCTKVFEDIECVELLLRIILKKDDYAGGGHIQTSQHIH